MKTLLIVNQTSGPNENPQLLTELSKALETQGIEAEIRLTTPDEDGQNLAATAAQAGTQLVIAAGGDGTIEAIARGLVHTQTVLGIIPLGTRNNIAASLSIPTDIVKAVRILVEGELSLVDMGKANDYYFIEVVGVGLEASLFPCGDQVKEGIKNNRMEAIKSFVAGFKTFLQFSHHHLVLRFDNKSIRRLQTLQVNICNSPRYGMQFALAPEAKMNDGKLDVIYINNPSKWDHLQQFLMAMRGKKLSHERLKTFQAAKIEVRSTPPLEVHADGTCIGNTPVTIQVVPQALRVCVPTPELLAKFILEEDSIPALNSTLNQKNKVTESAADV